VTRVLVALRRAVGVLRVTRVLRVPGVLVGRDRRLGARRFVSPS
jgi:hypothetical protein